MGFFSRLIRFGTIAAALAGVALIVLFSRMQAEREMPPAGDPPVSPPPKRYAESVAATGIIEALRDNVAVGVPHPGLVTEVAVKVNDAVSKGDVLFRLDDRDLRAEEVAIRGRIDAARAKLTVNRARIAKAETRLKRLAGVDDPRAVSQDDLENRRLEVDVAKAELTAAEAEVAASEAELQRLSQLIDRQTVRAPRDGTVLQVNIRGGEYAATGGNVVPAMIVGETGRLQVRADVDEQNATRIHPGQEAYATLKGDPDVTFPLEFVCIEPYVIPKVSLTGASTERVDTRVLQIIYAFDIPAEAPVYVGQQVDVFIQAPER